MGSENYSDLEDGVFNENPCCGPIYDLVQASPDVVSCKVASCIKFHSISFQLSIIYTASVSLFIDLPAFCGLKSVVSSCSFIGTNSSLAGRRQLHPSALILFEAIHFSLMVNNHCKTTSISRHGRQTIRLFCIFLHLKCGSSGALKVFMTVR